MFWLCVLQREPFCIQSSCRDAIHICRIVQVLGRMRHHSMSSTGHPLLDCLPVYLDIGPRARLGNLGSSDNHKSSACIRHRQRGVCRFFGTVRTATLLFASFPLFGSSLVIFGARLESVEVFRIVARASSWSHVLVVVRHRFGSLA